MRRLPALLLLSALALLPACDALPDSGTAGEVVVEAFFVAGAPLADVSLRRSVALGTAPDPGIADAAVRVELLRADGGVEQTYPYVHAGAGRYGAPLSAGCGPPPALESAPCVLPLRRYRLVAEVPGTGTVRAETLVPGAFELRGASADTVVYQGPEQITFTLSRSAYPGRNAIFLFTVESLLDPLTIRDAVPFVRSFLDQDGDGQLDEQDRDFTLEDLRKGSSPLLNEANAEIRPDGTFLLRLPWLGIAFLGPNRIEVNAVDDNLNDFLRSADVQQGGPASSPGEILNLLDHVENGTGVFGSYARVQKDVFIKE